MKKLPRIKVSDINLEPVTEKALITTIDTFRFIHEENSSYVTVVVGEEDYDFLDEIEISNQKLTTTGLEFVALAWISEHVEVTEVNKLEGIEMKERIKQLEEKVAELEGQVQEQPKEYQPKGLIYVTGKQHLKKGTIFELSDEVDKAISQYVPDGYIAYLHIIEIPN